MSDEFSEGQFKAVLATVDEWCEAFAKSREFAKLSDSHQRKAGAITQFFARYSYEYLGLSPAKWDRRAVVECCIGILPRKISAKLSLFEAISPVLSAFFSFLEDQSLLPNGRALAEDVASIHGEIVAHAQDRSNWSPAKHFVMAADDAGVDIHDQVALQAFMLQFNLRQFAPSDSKTQCPHPGRTLQRLCQENKISDRPITDTTHALAAAGENISSAVNGTTDRRRFLKHLAELI